MLLKIVVFLTFSNVCRCANILGVFVVPSVSHQVVFQPIWRELSLKGHQVTVMSPDILGDPSLKNLTEIDFSRAYNVMHQADFPNKMSKKKYLLELVLFFNEFGQQGFIKEMEHPKVQELLNSKDKSFDLILVECINPIVYGFVGRFNAPVIGVSSLGAFINTHDAVGNPTHPIISPDILFSIEGAPTFSQRVSSVLYNIWYRLLYHWYILPRADRAARKIFGNDIPYLGDIEKNVSLLLLNVNPILHTIRPNVPSIIELSQMHIKEKKPLPKDLQIYLDEATEGVIYFSLGSNVKSANLTEDIRIIIIDALSELPYKVLWKWETDHLPGQPKNVKINKWLPQQDVLGHPNIKAFVTQGGIQSLEEAISNGVPLIGMPFFADQPLNVKKMVDMRIARKVDYATMTKDELKSAILDVAENKSYKENVLKIKKILTDQPMSGVDKAVWWIEYVIRHKGAHHLRSPAADMSWSEYFFVDVIAFLLVTSGIIFYLFYKVVSFFVFAKHVRYKVKTS